MTVMYRLILAVSLVIAARTHANETALIDSLEAHLSQREWSLADSMGTAWLDSPERQAAEPRTVAVVKMLVAEGRQRSRAMRDTTSTIQLVADAIDLFRSSDDCGPELGRALHVLGSCYYRVDMDPEALDAFRDAVAVRREFLDETDPDLHRSLSNVANLLRWMGRLDESRQELEQLLELRVVTFGEHSLDACKTRDDLADLQVTLGRHPEGRALLRSVVGDLTTLGTPEALDRLPNTWNRLGISYYTEGVIDSAFSAFETAVELAREYRPGQIEYIVGLTSNLSANALAEGRFAPALRANLETLEVVDRAEHPGIWALVVDGSGMIYQRLGRRVVADLLFRAALEALGGQRRPDPVHVGRVMQHLAINDIARRRYEDAVVLARASRDSVRSDTRLYCISTSALGAALTYSGRAAEGLPYLLEGVDMARRQFGDEHPWTTNALRAAAYGFFRHGELDSAWTYVGRARRAAGSLGTDDGELSGIAADIEALRRQPAASIRTWQGLARRQRDRGVARPVSLELIQVPLAAVREGLLYSVVELASDPSDELVSEVYEMVIDHRGRQMELSTAMWRAGVSSTDSTIVSLVSRLQDTRRTLSEHWHRSRKKPGALADPLLAAALRKELAAIELTHALAEATPLDPGTPVDVDDLTAALARDECLVSYVSYAYPRPVRQNDGTIDLESRSGYVAFVLNPDDRAPTLIPLGAAGPIDSLIVDWRAEMRPILTESPSARMRSVNDLGSRLRRRIWDPVAPHVTGVSTVFIVSDWLLDLVDFHALPTAEGDGYLVQRDPEMRFLNTERSLRESNDPASAGSVAMIVADPSFDESGVAPDLVAAMRGIGDECDEPETFAPLNRTAEEAASVASIWSDGGGMSRVFLAVDASERRVREGIRGASVVHFATHGFYLGGSCVRSAAITAEGHATAIGAVQQLDPLVRSCLVLSGANRPFESHDTDGLLTAEEIVALDLRGVDLAVLSACETGLGTLVVGESAWGLPRAFQLAGARSVVMSLWKIHDAVAVGWMRRFYAAYLDGDRDVQRAVREASRALLAERERQGGPHHPFYWSGFACRSR